jgi:hypothetical protein
MKNLADFRGSSGVELRNKKTDYFTHSISFLGNTTVISQWDYQVNGAL